MGTRNARLLDLAYEPILVRDRDDRITYWNKGAERLYGWSSTAALGQVSHDLLRTRFPEPFETLREKFLRRREWQGELVHATSKGDRVVVSSRWVMDEDPTDGLLTLETNYDLTALQASQNALEVSERRFRSIFELSPVGIGIKDESSGRYLLVNEAYRHLTGYSESELLTRPVDIPPGDAYRAMLEGRTEVYRTEARLLRKDGQGIWTTVFARALDRAENGQAMRSLVLLEDVTARRAAETALQKLNSSLEQRIRQRTRDLEETNRDLEAFTYSVSHDLRAPLRAIRGFADALVEDYAERVDAQAVVYLRQIEAGSARMSQLIDDLLAYSRLGRASILLSPVSVSDAVEQAVQETPEISPAPEITLPAGLAVMAHPRTLIQVLINLLTNACKFTRPGVPARVRVSAEERGAVVRIWVEDNGIGIASEHRERIFQVFERLHGQETYPGTGIGLAIVRRCMERMNGGTGVESELGQGSRFWIELARVEVE